MFQQPLRGRDVVDVAVLVDAMTEQDMTDLQQAAEHWILAPEVREALARVNAVSGLASRASHVLARNLSAAAGREQARRAAAGPDDGGAAVVYYGLSLGPALSGRTVVVERDAGLTVVRCSVGGYLMVDTLCVPFELAQSALDRYPGAVLPG